MKRGKTNLTKAKFKAQKKEGLKCYNCGGDHRIRACSDFGKLSVKERRRKVEEKELCQSCFGGNHESKDCKFARKCNKESCTQFHYPMLHEDPQEAFVNTYTRPKVSDVAFGAIHVGTRNLEGELVNVMLMLNEGSDITLIREGLVNRLGLKGVTQSLNLWGVTGKSSTVRSRKVELELDTEGGAVKIEASSVPTICEPLPMVDWSSKKNQWNHLRDLPLTEVGGRVDIL